VLRAPKDNAGMTIAGVDGCRGQWLAAVSDGAHVSWLLVPTMRDLYDNRALTVIAIDVPIGLPESGRRACDNQARAALGARGSSVFAAPVRAVLGCATYAEARTVLAALAGPSMSAQAFGIVRAVRDVDGCVGPGDDDRVVETHPELAFLMLSGEPALAPKKSTAGLAARLRALARWRADALNVLERAPSGVPVDDALDALACLWVAERWAAGERRTFGDGQRDVRNLPMRIAPAP
jgi:predicted RNase H-like nuclease